jgi:hypothetical protein
MHGAQSLLAGSGVAAHCFAREERKRHGGYRSGPCRAGGECRRQAIAERGRQAEAAAQALSRAWDSDARAHLAENYAAELREEAASQDVQLFERDGRLYAFPLILRIDARDAAVRVGKKAVRTLRPKHLVKPLAAAQKRRGGLPARRRPVYTVAYLCEATIDERIQAILTEERALFADLVDGVDARALKKLDIDTLLQAVRQR